MEKQLLQEIRSLLAILIGTDDKAEPFSEAAVHKAAKEFKQLSGVRRQWVGENDLYKFFKGTNYGVGKFLRDELGFTQCFQQGRTMIYNRKALLALARELKERNVDLGRYIDYLNERKKFEAKLKTVTAKKKLTAYVLPDNMKNIPKTAVPLPNKQLIEDDLAKLNAEYKEFKMDQYVDVYNSFAVMKLDYLFGHYREDALMKRCRKWCDNYQYAQKAMTGLKM